MNCATEKRSRGLRSLGAATLGLILGTQPVAAENLRFWTTEEQPERLARQEQMAGDFEAATGHSVEVIPVTESELVTRTTAAFAAGDLPDVIYHGLQHALPWAEAGILDTEAATEVIEALGRDTFAPGALEMAVVDGNYVSVPVDGWTQFVVYRKDLFDESGLEPPTDYARVVAAMEALHNPPEMYGFVPHIKVDEPSMSQMLEYIFLANGISPVGDGGLKPLEEGPTIEALEFVKALAQNAPAGELYWQQSRELYFAGRTAMIMWSPFILDELAGLRDSAPPTINDDPTSRALAEATGIVTAFAGPSNPNGATWAELRFFGITADAETDAAIEFVEFSMDEGYTQTLAIAPEGKFPIRRGTGENPTAFVDAWAALDVGVDRRAPLTDIYPQELIDELIRGLDVAQRWGVAEGELALASKILNSQVINRIVREFIDGEIDGPTAVRSLNEQIAAIE